MESPLSRPRSVPYRGGFGSAGNGPGLSQTKSMIKPYTRCPYCRSTGTLQIVEITERFVFLDGRSENTLSTEALRCVECNMRSDLEDHRGDPFHEGKVRKTIEHARKTLG